MTRTNSYLINVNYRIIFIVLFLMITITYIQISKMDLFNPHKQSGKTMADLYAVSYDMKISGNKPEPSSQSKENNEPSVNEPIRLSKQVKYPPVQAQNTNSDNYMFKTIEDIIQFNKSILEQELTNLTNNPVTIAQYVRCVPELKTNCLSVCSDNGYDISSCGEYRGNSVANFMYEDKTCYMSDERLCKDQINLISDNEIVFLKTSSEVGKYKQQLIFNYQVLEDFKKYGTNTLDLVMQCVFSQVLVDLDNQQITIIPTNEKTTISQFNHQFFRKYFDECLLNY